jgi:hypothetical protein
MKLAPSLVALLLAFSANVLGDSANLTPSVHAKGAFTTEVVPGRTVWSATNMLYFDAPSRWNFSLL